MITRDDLVRGISVLLVIAGAATVCAASGLAASVDLDGSFRMDVEASETELPAVANLVATAGIFGEAWRATGRLTLADGEFTSFDVTDERTFGPLWLRSSCAFDPDLGFSHLGSTARFAILDLQLANYVFVSRDPTLSYDQLTAKASVENVALTGVWRNDLCPLSFRSAQAAAQWYVPRCDLFLEVRTAYVCASGFDYLRATGRFRRVPFLSNDVVETELRLTIQFEADRKEVTPSLRMRAGRVNACMTPFVRAVAGPSVLSLDGVEVYGWTVGCALGDAVEIELATSLDPASNRELTGDADAWEAWKLRGAVRSGCGRDLLWELSTYFENSGTALFDWGRTAASAEVPLGERLTARVGAEFRASPPRWTVDAGFEVRF